MAIKEPVSGENLVAIEGNAAGKGATGVLGTSDEWIGVHGKSRTNVGVGGESDTFHAIWGTTHSNFAGVFGFNDNTGAGVMGEAKIGRGVQGISDTGYGVNGESPNGIGVRGQGKFAGWFEGEVDINGVLKVSHDIMLTNADCAEDFDIGQCTDVEAGAVMVIQEDGRLIPCETPYDKRVAGVISGAGHYKPAIVLDKQESSENRQPIALVGKVYCKVDADYSPIEVGDLLTTSATSGHAMKAVDWHKTPGSVIGKALGALHEGKGLVPILIALQ